jgi:multidrug efflux pump subunit AcrA (membrane-fusion protein)
MRKGFIVLVLGTIALTACSAQPNSTAQTTAERTAAKRGTIRASVSASGKINPAGEVDLSFGAPGTVQDVRVSKATP